MPLFNSAGVFARKHFGGRVQKVAIDAGFSCPNRDGTNGSGGCIYCSNESFSPFYASAQLTITKQLAAGIEFYGRRYNTSRFFAYFQSFSGTHAPVDVLKARYLEALQMPGVEGLIIATRPDCLSSEVIALLSDFAARTYVRIELGVESFDDRVLRAINRCHDSDAVFAALASLKNAGIDTCIHLIAGLPEEAENSAEEAALAVSSSGAVLVKLHHLQIIARTRLASLYEAGSISFGLHTPDSYLDHVARFVSFLSPAVYIERLINRVPPAYLLAPRWGNITESAFQAMLTRKLADQGLFQGAKSGSKR
ncbi:MAG: TIGR01212 family radical SAM protein [Candidatus Riflebacteria bacterium]|jgi:radical SAM protein (TIGR01212 family)|nr:TIGR01212 family radical SAM protein [Candidatus Riflebacteria bacterium]